MTRGTYQGAPRSRRPARPGLAVLRLVSLLVSLLLGSGSASVALAAPPPGAVQALDDECARLRSELGRVNAEITALKRGDRGVRDDYRLRRRMADAEELARRLTLSEAELRRLRAPSPGGASTPTPTPAPSAGPAEAPGVLEARADLLSDEARRLSLRASSLERAADQLRARQSLRRRAGHLERDPFVAMEGSKRFMVVPGAPTPTKQPVSPVERGGAPAGDSVATAAPPPTTSQETAMPAPTAPPMSAPGAATPVSPPTPPPAPPATPGAPAVAPPAPPAPAPAPPAGTPTPTSAPPPNATPGAATGTPSTGNSGNPATTSDARTSFGAPGTPQAPGPAVAGSRALLDPDTLAELRRIEAAGGRALGEVERLQQAASVLARKAQSLEAQAKALRARAAER